MSTQAELLAEIARMDFELERITKELDALRLRVEGTTRSGRTQTFAGAPQSDRAALAPPTSRGPASTQPKPSNAPTTATRTIPPSKGSPEAPVSSRTAPTHAGRRVASPSVSVDDGTESPVPAQRRDSQPREVGRYEYVSEGRTRPASNRRG